MGRVYDACCLLEFTHDGPNVVRHFPEKYQCIQTKKPFLICSFPEKNEQNIVFSFNINRYLCFSWSFAYSNNIYSVVIISHHCFVSLFLKFLHSVQEKYSTLTPEKRLFVVVNLLEKWNINEQTNSINLFFPNTVLKEKLYISDSFYMNFNPSVYLGSFSQINQIFKAIILDKGLLIVGDDAEIVSCAVYSSLSLIAPIKYIDQYLLFTKYGDMRFAEIIHGKTKWRVVGTTNPMAAERCKQFETVVRIGKKGRQRPKIRDHFNKNVSILLKYIEHYLDKNLEKDPYSDLLDFPLDESQLESIAENTFMNRKELEVFLQTPSFINWRKTNKYRNSFREMFLSHTPEKTVENRSLSDLMTMENSLDAIKPLYRSDSHFYAVIKRHLKVIRNKIAEMNYSLQP